MEIFCQNTDFIYTRYSDDIIISAKSREKLEGIEKTLREMLGKHFGGRFEINRKKSKLSSIGRNVKILGMVVLPSGVVAVDMELKKRIEVLIHYYTRDEEIFLKRAKEADREASVKKLAGYINYVNAADPNYLEKLRRKYGAAVIDSFLHKSAR